MTEQINSQLQKDIDKMFQECYAREVELETVRYFRNNPPVTLPRSNDDRPD